jgi:hypothetical protein
MERNSPDWSFMWMNGLTGTSLASGMKHSTLDYRPLRGVTYITGLLFDDTAFAHVPLLPRNQFGFTLIFGDAMSAPTAYRVIHPELVQSVDEVRLRVGRWWILRRLCLLEPWNERGSTFALMALLFSGEISLHWLLGHRLEADPAYRAVDSHMLHNDVNKRAGGIVSGFWHST